MTHPHSARATSNVRGQGTLPHRPQLPRRTCKLDLRAARNWARIGSGRDEHGFSVSNARAVRVCASRTRSELCFPKQQETATWHNGRNAQLPAQKRESHISRQLRARLHVARTLPNVADASQGRTAQGRAASPCGSSMRTKPWCTVRQTLVSLNFSPPAPHPWLCFRNLPPYARARHGAA